MKVAIIGSRNINNLRIDDLVPEGTTVIISGGARGVDALAEAYADRAGIQKMIFKPDYTAFGGKAPLVRNRQIVREVDLVVAVWDGKSSGTRYTVNYARQIGKKVLVYCEAVTSPSTGAR